MKKLVVILAVAITLSLSGCEDAFKDMCVNDLDGKVVSDTKVNNYNGMGSDGKFVNGTITETTRFCVKDGQVVATS